VNEPAKSSPSAGGSDLARQIGRKEVRRLKGRRHKPGSVLGGLGLLGLVGWSVAMPMLLGAALGMWIDRRYEGRYSWTMMLMCLGLIIGCVNAWYWMIREIREIERDLDERDNNHHPGNHHE
jgi:ATP synthase protein I